MIHLAKLAGFVLLLELNHRQQYNKLELCFQNFFNLRIIAYNEEQNKNLASFDV